MSHDVCHVMSCDGGVIQVVSVSRDGQACVWDLSTEKEDHHQFSWSPGQHGKSADTKPLYRFRACWYVHVCV